MALAYIDFRVKNTTTTTMYPIKWSYEHIKGPEY